MYVYMYIYSMQYMTYTTQYILYCIYYAVHTIRYLVCIHAWTFMLIRFLLRSLIISY